MRIPVLILACLAAPVATAQEKTAPKADDLDVTMQIISRPDAKLPDEVVRHIPLPARKPVEPATNATNATKPASNDKDKGTDKDKGHGAQQSGAQQSGRDAAERSHERAREAAEQREQATRSRAEERRRHDPQPPHPNPPNRPPRG